VNAMEMELKLYRFRGGETDWFAAYSEKEARDRYVSEYGLHESDLDDLEIDEVDPDGVTVYLDMPCHETDCEVPSETAAEYMARMNGPGPVCSTAW
jgi:hypothetical protein